MQRLSDILIYQCRAFIAYGRITNEGKRLQVHADHTVLHGEIIKLDG